LVKVFQSQTQHGTPKRYAIDISTTTTTTTTTTRRRRRKKKKRRRRRKKKRRRRRSSVLDQKGWKLYLDGPSACQL